MTARTAVLAAFAALAVTVAPATAAAEPAEPDPAPPIEVRLLDATCHDLSAVSNYPPLLLEDDEDLRHTPMVRYEIRGLEQAQDDEVPFEVLVDDKVRSRGDVGAGGVVSAQVTLNRDAPTTVQVRSGEHVVERVYDARC